MADLGLQAYRFSVAWPRIQPDGTGPVNPRGLDFYDRLVDELLGQGHRPDRHALPLGPAADAGGPGRLDHPRDRRGLRRVRDGRARPARRPGDAPGPRSTSRGARPTSATAAACTRPARQDPAAAFAAVHHLLLGHGLAARALRAAGAQSVGITLNPASVFPADPENAADARRPYGSSTACTTGSSSTRCCTGATRPTCSSTSAGSPTSPTSQTATRRPSPRRSTCSASTTTTPTYVAAQPGAPGGGGAYPGTEGIAFLPPVGPVTDMGWQIEPAGLTGAAGAGRDATTRACR